MRKLLTAGIFGTILGIVGAGTVNASIVSSGFLDEKLTEMTNATTLQLDNKANQSDLVNLSNIVGTPMELTYNDIIGNSYFFDLIMGSVYRDTYGKNTFPANDISELIRLNYTDTNFLGLAGVVQSLFQQWDRSDPWPLRLRDIFDDYESLYDEGNTSLTELVIYGGTLHRRGVTVYGLPDLTTKIGTLPEGITVQGMYEGWTDRGGYYHPGLYNFSKNELLLKNAYDSESATLLIQGAKATTIDGVDYTGPIYPLWKLSEGIDKIGTLPAGITVQGMYDGWTDSNDGTTYLGVKDLNTKTGSYYWGPENEDYKYSNIPYLKELFSELSPDKNLAMSDMATNILVNYTQPSFPGLAGVTNRLLNGWWDENRVLANPGLKGMYGGWIEYGNKLPGLYEIASDTFKFKSTFSNVSIYRLLADGLEEYTYNNYTGPVYPLWKLSEGIDKIGSIETKIGDLPTEIPNMNSTWQRYGFVENPGTPIDLPDTIGGMFAMLFNEDASYNGLSLRNIMGKIYAGFDGSDGRIQGLSPLTSVYNLRGDSPIVTAVDANTAKIGTVPDGKNLAGMIGTLPDGYDSVGAALTAIKGIAEDAKAAALAAIPDPKQEGSSGKFVLTVDIVGDNATYRWEKIDREGETTTE